jgi:hypothetical protein
MWLKIAESNDRKINLPKIDFLEGKFPVGVYQFYKNSQDSKTLLNWNKCAL